MARRGSLFARNYSTGNASKTTFLEDFFLKEQEKVSSEEKGSTCVYAIPLEEVDHFGDIQDIT